MYQEGLISIDTIILSAKKDKTHSIAEYFCPEIIEKEPEIFEKEIKYKITCPYTSEYIQQFKEKRNKYLKWICESGDYHDPLYREIETNKLLYAIVTDDVNSFQKIISNLNININSNIKESLIQNSHRIYDEETILEFAMEYNAIKITKFLIMNNAKLTNNLYFSAITSGDLDMIHFLESNIPDNFVENIMFNSISDWNFDMTEYVLNNYDKYDFLEKVDIEQKDSKVILQLIRSVFVYINFSFFKTKLIPFFNNNKQFINDHLYEILNIAFSEQTGYFAKEFFKNPNFDVNHYSDRHSILGRAIDNDNSNVIELILKNPKIDINKDSYSKFPPLMFACGNYKDMKIIKLLANHPDIDANLRDGNHHVNAFEISVSRGHVYSTKYLINNVLKLNISSYNCLFYHALKSKYLMTLKIILEYYCKNQKSLKFQNLEKSVKEFHFDADYKDDYLVDLRHIYNEIIQFNIDE